MDLFKAWEGRSDKASHMRDPVYNPGLAVHPTDIGFDIDGVVADTMGAFLCVAREDFGITHVRREHITTYWLEECLPISSDIIGTIIDRLLYDPIGVGLVPFPGVRSALLALAQHGPLTFVTARPVGEPIVNWLHKLLPELPMEHLKVVATGHHAAKPEVLMGLGLKCFVEDHLETCRDIGRCGIQPIVFDQPWNQGPDAFLRVGSWPELVRLIRFLGGQFDVPNQELPHESDGFLSDE